MRTRKGLLPISVTVPYVRLADVDGETSGSGGVQADEDVDGLGDVTLGAEYHLMGDYASGAYAGVTAGVKLATGDDDDGLGTGEAVLRAWEQGGKFADFKRELAD